MLNRTANKETVSPVGEREPGIQPAAAAEREVQANLPHLRLDHASYQAKGLPATWLCTLHELEFRSNASYLARPGVLGCPDCIEQRALEKRKTHLADPDLDRHLVLIAERFSEEYARTYRLRCEGARLKDIATGYGLSEQGIIFRLRRISVLLG